ncbi:TetR/AcrR family transcriptional regulator [Sesbania bispinosa]|nr:TetR/AcrR family transcriptional regulator [Sesbania bispinosa]
MKNESSKFDPLEAFDYEESISEERIEGKAIFEKDMATDALAMLAKSYSEPPSFDTSLPILQEAISALSKK